MTDKQLFRIVRRAHTTMCVIGLFVIISIVEKKDFFFGDAVVAFSLFLLIILSCLIRIYYKDLMIKYGISHEKDIEH